MGCKSIWSQELIVYDGHLEALLDRNFNNFEKDYLSKIKISKDFQVFAEKQQQWNQTLRKIDIGRIKRLCQLEPILIKNRDNAQFTVTINTHLIFSDLQTWIGAFPFFDLFKDQKEGKVQKEGKSMDFLVLQKSYERFVLHRYFGEKGSRSVSYRITNKSFLKNDYYRISYNKSTEDVIFVSESNYLFCTNLMKMFDASQDVLNLKRCGRLSLNNPDKKIKYFSITVQADCLYIIGGRIDGIVRKEIYKVDLKNFLTDKLDDQEERKIPLQEYYKMKQGRALSGIIKWDHKMVIISGAGSGLNELTALDSIQLIKFSSPKGSETQEWMRNQDLRIVAPSVLPLGNRKFMLWGGNGDPNQADTKQQNQELLVVDLQDREIVFKKKDPKQKPLKFLTDSWGDTADGFAMLMRSDRNSENRFLEISCQEEAGGRYTVIYDHKQFQE